MHADVVATTSAAARRIIAFVADHRSFVQTFDWMGPPADPIAFHLSEPRRQVQVSFPWMLRIVDVRSALAERGYSPLIETQLHLRIADDVIGANDGPFVLSVSGGKAEIEPGGEGRLRIDVRGLATLYSGYASAHELMSTGYIEAGEDDLAAADGIFAGPAPWLADMF
jgi:predicted acetyltransferase